MQFLAPFTAATRGYFRHNGMHALISYDDTVEAGRRLSQMFALAAPPAGPRAYPGDVFYLHSRLLERAAKLTRSGRGSLTALRSSRRRQ